MTETKESLGDKIKAYEAKWETHLPNLPWVARLDGHGFSKFTKCFQKPSDPRITSAMVETTKDMVATFHANSGFIIFRLYDNFIDIFMNFKHVSKQYHYQC